MVEVVVVAVFVVVLAGDEVEGAVVKAVDVLVEVGAVVVFVVALVVVFVVAVGVVMVEVFEVEVVGALVVVLVVLVEVLVVETRELSPEQRVGLKWVALKFVSQTAPGGGVQDVSCIGHQPPEEESELCKLQSSEHSQSAKQATLCLLPCSMTRGWPAEIQSCHTPDAESYCGGNSSQGALVEGAQWSLSGLLSSGRVQNEQLLQEHHLQLMV